MTIESAVISALSLDNSGLVIGGLTILERHILGLYYKGVRKITVVLPNVKDKIPIMKRKLDDLNLVFTDTLEDFSDCFYIKSETVFHKTLLDELEVAAGAGEGKNILVTGKAMHGSLWLTQSEGFSVDGYIDLWTGLAFLNADTVQSMFKQGTSDPDFDIRFFEDNYSSPDFLTVSGNNRFFRRISGKSDVKAAESLLFHSLRKPQDGLIARYINRTLSLPASRLLSKTSLTPNQLSIINAVFAVFAGFFLVFGHSLLGLSFYLAGLLGGLFMQMCSIYDGCDGEIARVKFQYSHIGDWLDTIIDDITNCIFFASVAAWAWFYTGQERFIYMGIAAFIGQWLANYSMYYYLIKIAKTGNNQDYNVSGSSDSNLSRFLDKIKYLTKRDFHLFIFFIISLFGRLDIAAYFISAFAVSAGLILISQHIMLLIKGPQKAKA